MRELDDDESIASVNIGTAVPADKTKPIHVAIRVKKTEIYISAEDARDIANSIVECADYVDSLNRGDKVQ